MSSEVVVNGRFLARRITGVERHGRQILQIIGGRSRVESTPSQGWKGHVWEQFVLPGRLHRDSVLWSPANTGPVMVRKQALTIHDLSPLEQPEWYRRSFTLWYRLFLPVLARRVARIFAPSEFVRGKIGRRFRIKNVTVTPNGVDHTVFHPGAQPVLANMPMRYVMFVGTLQPRKSLNRLLDAWSAVKDEFKETWLIVVGVPGNVFKPLSLPGRQDRVRFLGYVDDRTLAGLYASATLFVLPSAEEGFGLPALEAMACGAPVIVSDGGALPEIVAGAGLVFRRSDPDQLQSMLEECLANEGLCSSLRERGLARAAEFPWQKAADVIWKNLIEI